MTDELSHLCPFQMQWDGAARLTLAEKVKIIFHFLNRCSLNLWHQTTMFKNLLLFSINHYAKDLILLSL